MGMAQQMKKDFKDQVYLQILLSLDSDEYNKSF